jgi:PPOX class probable F420-dependent enzyme
VRGVAGRRDAIKMSDDEMRAFLEAGRDLQVASINQDGTPHLVTMWYGMLDGEIAFWTYAKSQKVVNLRRDPRLSVLVATGEVYDQLKGVSIVGRAEIVDDADEVLRYGEAVYERYWGPLNDTVREGVRAMGSKRVVIRVKPEKVLSWDHSKLAGQY